MSTKPKNLNTLTRIYVLKDPDTLDIRYVGKTIKELIVRLGEHINESKRLRGKTHKINWINSILDKNKIPIIEQIDKCEWKDSENLEIFYVSKYKSLGYNLVNSTEGGEGVLGRIVSQETRNKISKTKREKLPKIYQYDLNGNLIREWNNAVEASETLNFKDTSGINRCLRGERFKYKDFIWKLDKVDNANSDLLKNIESRHIRNTEKNKGGYSQSILAKIISQESKLLNTPYYYVYSSNKHSLDNLLYEGISAKDISSFINDELNRTDISLESTITRFIKDNSAYYSKYYVSNECPSNYINKKHKALIIINYNNSIFYGVQEAAEYFEVTKTNIINNLKGKTKCLNTSKFGKIKLNWELNKEHGRLFVKTYGLSVGEIEESVKETSS